MKTHKTYSPTTQGKPHAGFTLVELLVTITIIIVLAALVFTISGKIRDNAKQSNAVAAMRQIGMANVAYAAENNGDLNTIRDSPGEKGDYEGKGGWVGNSFVGRMQPYLFSGIETTNQSLLKTRIDESMSQLLGTTDIKKMTGTIFSGVSVTTDGSTLSNPISVNDVLRPEWGPAKPPSKISTFGDPSSVLYLSFGRYYFLPEHIKTFKALPTSGDTQTIKNTKIYYLPNRKAIFAFLDGHVEMLSPPIDVRRLGRNPKTNKPAP